MAIHQLELFDEVDIIQVGARNMQNFTLLKELGRCRKPILLKRGYACTITELLMAAEYLMAGGNDKIILCERGIRSFDNFTRNVLDLAAIPALKKKSHLPVIVDPSHATGLAWMVPAMAKAAIAAGADGLIIEVHNNPECALCDGEQSITPEQSGGLMGTLRNYADLEGKTVPWASLAYASWGAP
jgi:3-deoxy-7-phosphoheptulonate synthase